MTERKWTPGPWIVLENHPANACVYLCDESGGEIATLYHAPNDCGVRNHDGIWSKQPERQANAHLIAAAPDLYEALQAMVDYCNAECGSKIYPGHQAILALAKARGETQ